jgi:hypothetical protein
VVLSESVSVTVSRIKIEHYVDNLKFFVKNSMH